MHWGKEIDKARGDEPLVACTLSSEAAVKEFDEGFGGDIEDAEPFTAWSQTRVFFPVVYDGSLWVGSVPRDPCDEVTEFQGGGGWT